MGVYSRGNPLVISAVAAALNDILPEGTVSSCPKWYASEPMSMYLERYPGVFAFLGIRNEELGTGAKRQNEKLDVDDNVL